MEDDPRQGSKRKAEEEEHASNTEARAEAEAGDVQPAKRARVDDAEAQDRHRARKGKDKDEYEERSTHHQAGKGEASVGVGGSGGGDDEERAMELERQREGEEEERRAARKASSRFQQTFREDAEFGRVEYSHIANAAGTRRGDDQEGLEGEEEARGEASLAEELAHGSGYTLQGKEVPIEPFNLSEDLEMGYFDATGNFIFTRRDKDGEEDDDVGDDMGNLSKEHRADALQADAWLRDSETLATTRAVPSRAPAPAAPKEEEPVNLLELKRRVCEVLLPDETVQQALQRLGKTIKLARAAQGKAKGKARGKAAASGPVDEETKQKAAEHLEESRRKLNLVTDAASKLFDDGWVNVYDYTRERILSTLLDSHDSKPQQSLLGSTSSSSSSSSSSSRYASPPAPIAAAHSTALTNSDMQRATCSSRSAEGAAASGVMWEYKQSEEGELYGPYATEQMAAWYDDGFFRGESLAFVRRVGETEFVRSDTIDFHQLNTNVNS